MRAKFVYLFASLAFAATPACSVPAERSKAVQFEAGWIEQVRVTPPDIRLHAKLDTGADSCSVHAEGIETFKKKKERWVRFELANRYGERQQVERKIIRSAKIKTKKGGVQRRPVVRLGLCLGDHYEQVECNIVDRSHFSYPVLVGRNYLSGNIVVNSSVSYTSEPNCQLSKRKQ